MVLSPVGVVRDATHQFYPYFGTTQGRREGIVFDFYSWPGQNSAETKQTKGRIRVRIRQSLAATAKASAVLEKGLQKDNIEDRSRAYLRWYAASLAEGVRYVGYLDRYIGLVDRMEQKGLNADLLDSLLGEIAQRREYNAKSRLEPVDYLGGALAGRNEILDFITLNLQKMLADLKRA